MAIGTTNFPASLDTATELIRAVNDSKGLIDTGGATNSATTINIVAVPSSAPADGIAVIVSATDDTVREIVSFTGKTGTSLTGVTRNLESSGAKTWLAGDIVYFDTLTALSRTVLVNSIIALETKVGAGEILRIYQGSDYTGTSDTTSAQKLFNGSTNGAANVVASTIYHVEGEIVLRTADVDSAFANILFGGTATLNWIRFGLTSQFTTGVDAFGAGAAFKKWVTVATATALSAANASAKLYVITINGHVSINGAGTLIPQYSWSAANQASPITGQGSWLRMTPVSAATLGTWT